MNNPHRNIRTEITVTVKTYIGTDIGEEAPYMYRAPEASNTVSLVRVSPNLSGVSLSHSVRSHVETLLASCSAVIPERQAHQVRKL